MIGEPETTDSGDAHPDGDEAKADTDWSPEGIE